MQTPTMLGEIGRMATQAAFIVAPILFAGYMGYRKLWWILMEYRPHSHTERRNQQLNESGIRYPRTMTDTR